MKINTVTSDSLDQIFKQKLHLNVSNMGELLAALSEMPPAQGIKIARKQGRAVTSRFFGVPLDQQENISSGLLFKDAQGCLSLISLLNRNKAEGDKEPLTGEGGYSTVKPAIIWQDNKPVSKVVKRIDINSYLRSRNRMLTDENVNSLIKQHQKEVDVMRKLHRDAELIISDSGKGIKLYILMDNLGVNMEDVIYNQRRLFNDTEQWFSLERELFYFIAMMREMNFLHIQGFTHNDFKPQNFTLKGGFQMFVIDFNLTKSMGDTNGGYFGTRAYCNTANWKRYIYDQPAINNPDSDFGALKRCFFEVMGGEIIKNKLDYIYQLLKFQKKDKAFDLVKEGLFIRVVDKIELYRKNHEVLEALLNLGNHQEVFKTLLELRSEILEEFPDDSTFKLLINQLSKKLNGYAQSQSDNYQRHLCLVIDDILFGVAIEEKSYNDRFKKAIIYIENEIIPKLQSDLRVNITSFINNLSIFFEMIEKITTVMNNYLYKDNVNVVSWVKFGYQAKNEKICASIFNDLLRKESNLAAREKFLMIQVLLQLDIENIQDLKKSIVSALNKTNIKEANVFMKDLVSTFYEVDDLDTEQKIKAQTHIDSTCHEIIQHMKSEIHKLSWLDDKVFDKESLYEKINVMNMQLQPRLSL